MKKKFILFSLVVFMLILLCTNNNVQAYFQSNKAGSSLTYSLNDWIWRVRGMEGQNQVMGLNENISSITSLEATTEPNNIDVHLLKNTEYGAIVILSASPQYGKQGTGSNSYIQSNTSTGIATTTGNKYGIYDMGTNYEWVAGGGKTSYYNGGYKAVPYSSRYYNIYDPLTAKTGDVTTETKNWKGSSYANFVYANNAFIRGYYGAFSFNYGSSDNTHRARAAVVCGSGF